MTTTIEKLRELQQVALTNNKFELLQDFYNTAEYKALPYIVRNSGFISSHKLKDFMRCQFCYAQKYINEVRPLNEDVSDALTVGQALDDLLTEGMSYFKGKYEEVARRTKDAVKVQLTKLQWRQVMDMYTEFQANKLFNRTPKKKIVLLRWNTLILKIELDDFDQEKAVIRDIKSATNLQTFNPANYLHQQAFYAFVISRTFNLKCPAVLEVVDKCSPSKSAAFIFPYEKLEAYFEVIEQALGELELANKTGIFTEPEDQVLLWGCEFYGYKNHGRLPVAIEVK